MRRHTTGNWAERDAACDPVVIVGAGPVGMRVSTELARRLPGTPQLILGEEPWDPYDRVRLSALLAGELRLPELQTVSGIDGEHIRHLRTTAVAIDTASRTVIDAAGRGHRYACLVLATGSYPHVPEIPGIRMPGCYTLRNLGDAHALRARQFRSRHTVVLGGGLLGLEAARAMQRYGTRVTVIEHQNRLMAQQLDNRGAALLERHVTSLGIRVLLCERLVEVHADAGGRVCAVSLGSGPPMRCDTVVVATGIRPRIELAQRAGLAYGRGILVNDRMRTSHPDIYAVGECAEHDGRVYGLVAPGFEQAAVAVTNIAGGDARYVGSVPATQLKILGRQVYSLGELGETRSLPGARDYHWEDAAGEVYRKLVLHRGRCVGVVALGPWPALPRVQDLVLQRRRVRPWQCWRFQRTGFIWHRRGQPEVAMWPASATVCNCVGASRGALTEAIEAGCASVEGLSETTGAGTVCGSCRPLLAELLGRPGEPPSPTPAYRWLAGLALAAGALAVAVPGLPALPYAGSFPLDWHWEALWRSGTLKQVSGFGVLGLSLTALLLSLRKRTTRLRWGSYPVWRVAHVALACLALAGLWAHTGGRLGSNLNRYLMLTFLAMSLVGVASAGVAAFEHRLSPALAKRLRRQTLWLHVMLFWPLPSLLGFHVLKTFYY